MNIEPENDKSQFLQKKDLVKNLDFFRIVSIERDGKALACGAVYIGHHDTNKGQPIDFLQQYGLLCNMFIREGLNTEPDFHEILMALCLALESLAWLYNCKQVYLLSNEIPNDLIK